jgi:hypothetical protein
MTKQTTAFTICARNYYGLAQVLRQSIQTHDPDIRFVAFIADGIPPEDRAEFGADAIDAVELMSDYVSEDTLRDMAFKYNLTEYCTAIKPFCFRHVFDRTDADASLYLDPDIFVFSSLAEIIAKLQTASIVLTPHIIFPSLHEGARADNGILATGVFNLGFLGLARSDTTHTFLRWWSQRLVDQCFVDNHDALFTDQKWMDFVPTLFPSSEVCSFRHAGLNLAPWNFHEREVSPDAAGGFLVSRRIGMKSDQELTAETRSDDKLVFVHFSGFDYKKFCSGQVAQYNLDGLTVPADLNAVIERYMAAIQAGSAQVLRFLGKPYRYATFDNGATILSFHRRLYRAALDAGKSWGNPFATTDGGFYRLLKQRSLLAGRGTTASLDKTNKRNLTGLGRKLSAFSTMMRLVKRVVGFENYLFLLRLMRPYSRPEAQLHLLDRSLDHVI